MIELQVSGMNCGHCIKAVTTAIQQQAPGANVSIDLASGRVSIDNLDDEPALLEQLAAAIKAEGYSVSPVVG